MEDLQKTIRSLPHEPGVYLYHDAGDTVIYVGKAVDLSRRVKQYFQKDDAVGDKTKRLVSEITRIEIIPVTSEFDALLLEAKLIRKYLPKYNVISRDDKSPLYIGLTLSEPLPQIVFLRKGQIPAILSTKKNVVFGPFQSAYALRTLLRQIRSAVPYCTQKQRTGKACFYTHLGLCRPCPSAIIAMSQPEKKIATRQYRRNIFRLKAIFEGKTLEVRRQYEQEMNAYANTLQFEEAADLKKKIDTLYTISEYRYDPNIFMDRGASDVYEEELDELGTVLRTFYPKLNKLNRIECYDMSQLYQSYAVGSMVVLIGGRPETSQYRRFRIRTKGTISDTTMMREVLLRRFTHREWSLPDFLLVDGGKPQVQVAREVLASLQLTIPFGGLAKRQEEVIFPDDKRYKTLKLPLSGKAIKVLQRVRDEAHRFAITYHRLLRNRV